MKVQVKETRGRKRIYEFDMNIGESREYPIKVYSIHSYLNHFKKSIRPEKRKFRCYTENGKTIVVRTK